MEAAGQFMVVPAEFAWRQTPKLDDLCGIISSLVKLFFLEIIIPHLGCFRKRAAFFLQKTTVCVTMMLNKRGIKKDSEKGKPVIRLSCSH